MPEKQFDNFKDAAREGAADGCQEMGGEVVEKTEDTVACRVTGDDGPVTFTNEYRYDLTQFE